MNASNGNDVGQKSESTRGFWALFITQFQGAFSDNVLKWLAIYLVTGLGLSKGDRDQLVSVVGFLFAVPFIVFSMPAGFLADRFSKRTVTLGVKGFELLVMSLPSVPATAFLSGLRPLTAALAAASSGSASPTATSI